MPLVLLESKIDAWIAEKIILSIIIKKSHCKTMRFFYDPYSKFERNTLILLKKVNS
jgi:hypothetical protein